MLNDGPPACRSWAPEFPLTGTPLEKLKAVARYALLAPSGHNSQPWLFRPGDDYLDLLADRSRALPVVDPEDRELVMSCGCALLNLRVALEHFGYRCLVEILPDPADPDLLARIREVISKSAAGALEAHDLRTRHAGRATFIDFHLVVPGQMPVSEAPDGNALESIVGAISEKGLLDRAFRDPGAVERTVGEVMDRPLPSVDASASLTEAFSQLTGGAPALLAVRDGRPVGIVTKLDVLEFLAHHPSHDA